MDELTLQKRWRDKLRGGETITFVPPITTETFRVNSNNYTLQKLCNLPATASLSYDNLIYVLKKYISLHPNPLSVDLNNLLLAFDLYFGSTRFLPEICHTIRTKINAAITANPIRDSRNQDIVNNTIGRDFLALSQRLMLIGFPLNHAGGNNCMFRPEYELSINIFREMSFFGAGFGNPHPLKPNYHTELLRAIQVGYLNPPCY